MDKKYEQCLLCVSEVMDNVGLVNFSWTAVINGVSVRADDYETYPDALAAGRKFIDSFNFPDPFEEWLEDLSFTVSDSSGPNISNYVWSCLMPTEEEMCIGGGGYASSAVCADSGRKVMRYIYDLEQTAK